MRTAAIVLAAGRGKRMAADVAKQYLLLAGKPILFYALDAFEKSEVDEIVLVTGAAEIQYCQKEIVERFGFAKVRGVVAGGKERYHSVYQGLAALENCDYVLIHDGARPFVTPEMIHRMILCAKERQACVAGMPSKDTVKLADADGFVKETPNRSQVWNIQTPQTFSFPLIVAAYDTLMKQEKNLLEQGIQITDDAMVVEYFTGQKVKLTEGSYQNIKITTPEDLHIAEAFLRAKECSENPQKSSTS